MEKVGNYKIITITHKHAQLKKIGQYVLPKEDTPKALGRSLHELKESLVIEELQYLATCNRVMFFFTHNAPLSSEFVRNFFDTVYGHLPTEEREACVSYTSTYEGQKAIQHLFEVASSIDSMVVGEREILRQLRQAYEQGLSLGTTGDSIRIAMTGAVNVAKRIYSHTQIGEKPISIVSLSIQKIQTQNIPNDAHFLIIGAGQTNSLFTKLLVKQGFKNFTIFNRTYSKGQELANKLGAKAYRLSDLETYTGGFDVIVTCTNATDYIITQNLYSRLLAGDTNKKILLDLAVPYNINPLIATKYKASYIGIEHLETLAQQNMSLRKKEMFKAGKIIDYEVDGFIKLFEERQLEKALHNIPQQIKAVKGHAVENVFKKELDKLDEATLDLVQRMMDYMERRCISIPMKEIKKQLVHDGEERKATSKKAKQRILKKLISKDDNP